VTYAGGITAGRTHEHIRPALLSGKSNLRLFSAGGLAWDTATSSPYNAQCGIEARSRKLKNDPDDQLGAAWPGLIKQPPAQVGVYEFSTTFLYAITQIPIITLAQAIRTPHDAI
jgi:hypothetical protein